ncbi:MAG: helix-turn-helix domain-containing protein [Tatlockia sp.]|nr:helix-turn-helix domain-containing protein [Tatlockia sp.]
MIDSPLHPLLQPYVKSIDIVDSGQSTDFYKVYPGLSIVMGFQFHGSIAFRSEEDKVIPLKQSGITGLLTNYRSFQSCSPFTKTILIKVYPWAINSLFNESANLFTNQSLGLADLINEQVVNLVEEKIHETQELKALAKLIQEFLIQLYQSNNHKFSPPQRIIHIAQNLIDNPSQESIQDLARHYGYSPRSLERYFQTHIGLSPKKYMRISRFQKVLEKIQKGGSWASVAEQFNYYDQSHFIKDFQQFTGETPEFFSIKSS